jgi:hypothetical protein
MNPPKNSFCFAPLRNHPKPNDAHPKYSDATGAFHPYMAAYEALYSTDDGKVTTLKFNNHAAAKRECSAGRHREEAEREFSLPVPAIDRARVLPTWCHCERSEAIPSHGLVMHGDCFAR